MNNESQILEDSIFKIGEVVSVDGRIIRIKVDKSKNTSHLLYKGDLLKNVSVGGYIKIIKGFTKIVGKVDGEFTSEDPMFSKKEYHSEKEKINRVLAVSLLGFFNGDEFERGIKELPLVGNECFLLQNEEFNNVHDFLRNGDDPINLGRLALEKGQSIKVGVNSLFASHIGIFGNTGSGKSYTLAKIYRELFELYKTQTKFRTNAKFFLIDFNGEYAGEEDTPDIITDSQYKKVYRLSTRVTPSSGDKFPISKEVLNDPSFWMLFLEATEKTQAPFLNRALEGGFSRRLFGNLGDGETIDSRLREKIVSMVKDIIEKKDKGLGVKIFLEFFSDLRIGVSNQDALSEIIAFLGRSIGFNGTTGSYYVNNEPSLNRTTMYEESNIESFFINPLIEKVNILNFETSDVSEVRLKIIFKYYDEMVRGHSNRDHISPLIKRLESRIKDLEKVIQIEDSNNHEQDGQKNLTIVSFKDVNIHIRKILPLLLCKNLYDDKKKSNNPTTYLNIIIDEAHNILSDVSERESEQWKDYRLEAFEEIIKEGRKFGVFLTIASQRPADISMTIISQLHNYFLHRLINNNDIYAVEKTISYLDKVSFGYLPILPTGTCILAGLLAQIPVVVDIGQIPKANEPKNKTMTLTEKWKDSLPAD
jgi:DNA helicase HerA-like ATPase